MRIIFIIVILLSSLNSFADELYLGLYTHHMTDYIDPRNNNNEILIYTHNEKLIIGTMVNSFYRRSFMIGYKYKVNKFFTGGILFATGYKNDDFSFTAPNDKSILLMPIPFFNIELPLYNYVSLSTNIIPFVAISTGVTVSFKFDLEKLLPHT